MELINQKELNKVVNLVGTNNVSCLVAPTGSGKSTLVPVEFVKTKQLFIVLNQQKILY